MWTKVFTALEVMDIVGQAYLRHMLLVLRGTESLRKRIFILAVVLTLYFVVIVSGFLVYINLRNMTRELCG